MNSGLKLTKSLKLLEFCPTVLYCEHYRLTMEKEKFELEFPLRASPKMLFPFLSTPSGLSEWFCDDVNSRTEVFTHGGIHILLGWFRGTS